MNDVAQSAGLSLAWAVLFLGVLLILAYRRSSLTLSCCVLGIALLAYWALGSAPEWWKILVSVPYALLLLLNVRPLRLRKDHAHQIVRTRMGGRQTYRITGMLFRSGQIAALEQQHRQFLGGIDVVGIDRNEPLEQYHCGLLLTRLTADLIEHPQCARETRGDVLLRNKELFVRWKKLGLEYMFLGLEAIDEEGLRKYRKRISLGHAFEALEFARSLGIQVAINLIADPDWDRERFAVVRQWCMEIPEIVNISVNTPYPGTETWRTEARRIHTRDYRLYDIQHAVLPTRLPLADFYEELVGTQRVLAMKHMGWAALRDLATIVLGHLAHGQTNFVRSLWKFDRVFDPKLLLDDHRRPVTYEMKLPPPAQTTVDPRLLYVLQAPGRQGRAIDDATEQFVDATRMGTSE